ncbi:MAG: methyltransferase domain-containing protein [Verrucomicrobia bacterium]|nr:methyltransferase domain-containing protein [Verrucomicrobiota bacterium]
MISASNPSLDLRPEDVAYFRRGHLENRIFWRRMGLRPALHGMRVLEVGCGLGSLCVDVALGGARKVLGLDTDSRLIGFATTHVKHEFPQIADRVEFRDLDLGDYHGEGFDLIISKDSFEHIMDLGGMLEEMKRCLEPGGRIFAGFGPLYNSPFGHHGRIITWLPWRRFPWGHLLESEERIVARMNRRREEGENIFCYHDGPIASIRDLGLNQNSLADYRRIIGQSGLRVVSFRVNQSANCLSKVCSLLRYLPGLEEYFTHNVYCVLEKV